MKRYSYYELNAFVNRASSMDQVKIAHDFLMKQTYLSAEDMEFLIEDLQQVAKEIRAEQTAYNPEVWDRPCGFNRWR